MNNTNKCEKRYAQMMNGHVFKWILWDFAYFTGLIDFISDTKL